MSRSAAPAPQGKTAASLRSSNLALVLQEILFNPSAPSRADLAARLGMTRSTMSRLVDELVEGRFVTEGDALNVGRGRPAVPLHPAAGTLVALGIEINVDRTVVSIVDLTGQQVASKLSHRDSAELGPHETLRLVNEEVEALVGALPEGASLVGAHLVVPGLVDQAARTILRAPNLHWDGMEPARLLQPFLESRHIPFDIGNDVNAAAVTVIDDALRSGEQPPSFVYVAGEVGIGAAITLGGVPIIGQQGWAGEIGHICIDPEGPVCGCGARGCLESVIGLDAVLRRLGLDSLTELLESLRAGDERTLQAAADVGSALGRALSNTLNVFDVSTVVIGGYLAALDDWLLPSLASEMDHRVLWAQYSSVDIRVADPAPHRAARGAALIAMHRVIADPASWIGQQVDAAVAEPTLQ